MTHTETSNGNNDNRKISRKLSVLLTNVTLAASNGQITFSFEITWWKAYNHLDNLLFAMSHGKWV